MENEPIYHLEKQKESNKNKMSATQIINGINRWAKYEKKYKQKLRESNQRVYKNTKKHQECYY